MTPLVTERRERWPENVPLDICGVALVCTAKREHPPPQAERRFSVGLQWFRGAACGLLVANL